MMWKVSLALAAMATTAAASTTNDYTDKRASVGEFYPPPPNARETKHLEFLGLKKGEKLPPPSNEKLLSIIDWAEKRNIARALETDNAEAQMFMEVESRATGRKLLQDAAGAATVSMRVPHNWYVHSGFKHYHLSICIDTALSPSKYLEPKDQTVAQSSFRRRSATILH